MDATWGHGVVDSGEAAQSLLRTVQALDADGAPQIRAPDPVPAARRALPDDDSPQAPGSNQHAQRYEIDGKEVIRREVDLKTLPIERELTGLRAEAQLSRDMLDRLMLYEHLDGRVSVIDGSKRVAMAKASPETTINVPALVLKEFAGWSEADARTMALQENIRRGDRTDPIKIARQIKANPDLIDKSVEITAPVQIARALATLSDDAFALIERGEASPLHGALVAEHVADPVRQAGILRELQDLAGDDIQAARNLLPELLPPQTVDVADALTNTTRSEFDRQQPLDAGSKIDEPGGPEAAKQTQRLTQNLAPEIAEAKKQPERVAKAIEKADTKLAKLREEIASLESERLDAGKVDFDILRQSLPKDANGDPDLTALSTELDGRPWRELSATERQAVAQRLAPEAIRPDPAVLAKLDAKRAELRDVLRQKAAAQAPSRPRLQADAEQLAKVQAAIDRMAGIVPEGVSVKLFSSIDDLPVGMREEVIAGNQAALAQSIKAAATARTREGQLRASVAVEQAMQGQAVAGFALADTIWIATYASDPDARMAHETVHALKNKKLLGTEEVAILAERARRLGIFRDEAFGDYRSVFEARAGARGLDADAAAAYLKAGMDEEAAAHLIDAHVRGMDTSDPRVKTILERIAEFFQRVREAFGAHGADTADDIIRMILSGEAAKRELARRVQVEPAELVGPPSRFASEGDVKYALGDMMFAFAAADRDTGQSMRRDLDHSATTPRHWKPPKP